MENYIKRSIFLLALQIDNAILLQEVPDHKVHVGAAHHKAAHDADEQPKTVEVKFLNSKITKKWLLPTKPLNSKTTKRQPKFSNKIYPCPTIATNLRLLLETFFGS